MELSVIQWVVGGAAALLVGMSKTGIPGLGILVVLLLAIGFTGWNSIGIMLPMLIVGDIFAAAWYKRHVQWNRLVKLLPWVLIGVVAGAVALNFFSMSERHKALLNPVIGVLVLVMLALHLLEGRLGPHMTPRSLAGTITAGTAAGFTTTVSNAAGPIMMMYLAAHKMPKEQFMGTIAWYFFIINLTKVPVYLHQGLFTRTSLLIDLAVVPVILLGVFAGKWLFPHIPQRLFDIATMVLAGVGAVYLIVK